MRSIEEQTILVTGATDGLGRALASELAKSGATVLLHGRDQARGRELAEELMHAHGDGTVHWLRADLSSLDEVRGLANQLIAEFDALHGLVNNAGIGTTLPGEGRRVESQDGYELRFAVNYLAGYLLTRRLLALLSQSAPARIVNVSSAAQAPLDFDDLMLERHYDGGQAYAQSKLAQVMFTLDLAEELAGSGVTATALHPGTYMPTKMVRAAGVSPVSSLDDGVHATLRLLTDPDLDGVSGVYFNGLREAQPHPQARDERVRRRLREISDRLVAL